MVVNGQEQDNCSNQYFFNLYKDIANQPYIAGMAPCSKNGIISVGWTNKTGTDDVTDGLICRIDQQGNMTWIKLVKDAGNERVFSITLLSDGNYAAFGITDRYFFIIKFNEGGDIIWRKQYEASTTKELVGGKLKEDITGELVVVGNFVEDGLSFQNRILYLKTTNEGNLILSKFYYPLGLSLIGAKDFTLKDGFTYAVGQTYETNGFRGIIMKINNTTGDVSWIKAFDLNGGSLDFVQVFNYSNNSLCITGQGDLPSSSSIYILDTEGKCTKANFFEVVSGTQRFFPTSTMSSNYELFLSYSETGSSLVPDVFRLVQIDPNKGILKQYKLDKDLIPTVTNALTNTDGSIYFCGFKQFPSVDYQMFIGKLSAGGNAACPTSPTALVFKTATQKSSFLNWQTKTKAFLPQTPSIKLVNTNLPTTTSLCNISIKNNCDTIKIHQLRSVCSTLDTVKLSAYLSAGCTTPIHWNYNEAAVQYFNRSTETSISLVFNKAWQGYVYADITLNCVTLKDSIFINISNPSEKPDLGKDTVICPDAKIILHLSNLYNSYRWFDGSVEARYTVSQPGTYGVLVTDACGLGYTDTIVVLSPGDMTFELGADRSKCANDTILITAPAGFANYNWSPALNLSDQNAQMATVFPVKNTTYYVQAEKFYCPVIDSIKVLIVNTTTIHLGADTAICQGDSIQLDAGLGFKSYSWSNGEKIRNISVKNKGIYTVAAKDINDCVVRDTLEIVGVNSAAKIQLPLDGSICRNTTKLLDAGAAFTTYNWNTGETSQSIVVSKPGLYWISGLDQNQCRASDSIIITGINDLPQQFLPVDTGICEYETLYIKAASAYKTYVWNTGASSPGISISKTGFYWLKVTGSNGCVGSDTINIYPKQCLTGFYAPSAFTPNNDGLNDIFRPIIGGNITEYYFSIYNRFGQRIFETKIFSEGWNGTLKGIQQNPGSFVWQCNYRLNNQQAVLKKGSIVLLR